MKKLVLYSGPCCVGKGPLRAALEMHYPEYVPGNVGRVVLYTSRPRRDHETDGVHYHFRSVDQIREMSDREPERYITGWIRGNEQFQALDLLETRRLFETHELVLAETYHLLGAQLLEPKHVEYFSDGKPETVQADSVFLSPLSAEEIMTFRQKGVDVQKTVTELMRRKLARRATESPEKQLVRAQDAPIELRSAHKYRHIVVNHDGEDSENWGLLKKGDDWHLPYPIGDAKTTLEIFVNILRNGGDWRTECWSAETVK